MYIVFASLILQQRLIWQPRHHRCKDMMMQRKLDFNWFNVATVVHSSQSVDNPASALAVPRRHTELRTYAQKEEKPPVLKKRPRKGRAAEDEAVKERRALHSKTFTLGEKGWKKVSLAFAPALRCSFFGSTCSLKHRYCCNQLKSTTEVSFGGSFYHFCRENERWNFHN